MFNPIRFPWDITNPIGYLASVPFFLVLFILVFYSVICALGMMLAVFVTINAACDFAGMQFFICKRNFDAHRNKRTFLAEYNKTLHFAVQGVE